jgi:hypothetical protein
MGDDLVAVLPRKLSPARRALPVHNRIVKARVAKLEIATMAPAAEDLEQVLAGAAIEVFGWNGCRAKHR